MNKNEQARFNRLEHNVCELADEVRQLAHYTTFVRTARGNLSLRTVVILILQHLQLRVDEVEPSVRLVSTKKRTR